MKKPSAIRMLISLLVMGTWSASSAWATGRELPLITVMGDHFVASGKEFKIWGFNLGHGLNLGDQQLADQAQQLDFLGVNMLRLHTLDWTYWGDGNGPQGEAQAAGLRPCGEQRADTRSLVNIGKFWRFMDALAPHGIYVAVTLNVCFDYVPGDATILQTTAEDEKAWREAVAKIGGDKAMQLTKILPAIDERALALNQEWATKLLTLKRPGTGRTLARDPQLALLTVLNESSCWRVFFRDNYHLNTLPPYFMDKVTAKWNGWLKAKYGTDDRLAAAWRAAGKKGLLPGESLARGTLQLLPVDPVMLPKEKIQEMSFEFFSKARADDYLAFLTSLDVAFYEAMLKTCRAAGWQRPLQYQDMVGVGSAVAAAQFRAGLLPFVEDHPYDEANIDLYNWDWIKVCQYHGANCDLPELLDRPHWASEINAGSGWSGAMRLPYLLFLATYHSLEGRDGITWHVWTMNRDHLLRNDEMTRLGGDGWHANWDPQLLLMYRAAGRLFKSCEITPLAKDAPARQQFKVGKANFRNAQVYRQQGEAGAILRVETEHFRCVTVPRAETIEFADLTIALTSKTYNTVVVEKLGRDRYEITAVGRTGGGGPPPQPHNVFNPLEFVTGKVAFKDPAKQIREIQHLNAHGQVLETVSCHAGRDVPLLPGIQLYRVILEPAGAK